MWGDSKSLSPVGHCLKEDAKTRLNKWVTNDRYWSNFIKDFKSLIPQQIDYAVILRGVINTSSNNYPTYAQYARRSTLRLQIVQVLSNDLKVLIVIRGISDVQVRAAGANSNLTLDNLVSFSETYAKPTRVKHDSHALFKVGKKRNNDKLKCYGCGQVGHTQNDCRSRNVPKSLVCTFCKKNGHKEAIVSLRRDRKTEITTTARLTSVLNFHFWISVKLV